jgi:hypothetical protein
LQIKHCKLQIAASHSDALRNSQLAICILQSLAATDTTVTIGLAISNRFDLASTRAAASYLFMPVFRAPLPRQWSKA